MDFCYCDICKCNGGDCKKILNMEGCSCGEELKVKEIVEIAVSPKICEVCENEYHPDKPYKSDGRKDCTSTRFIGQTTN